MPPERGAGLPGEERIESELAAVSSLLFAVLFGSRASGHARPDSDWDVGIYVDPGLSPTERADVRSRLITSLEPRDRVDVVVLNDAPPLLAHWALLGRVVEVRDPEAYTRFFVRTLGLAADDAFWNELHARERRRRLQEGRFGRP